jgi:uncharacterized damage-inducible protein DinB
MSALNHATFNPKADNEKLLALLRESRERFLQSFTGVTDDESRRRPGDGQWSVLDTVEHLTVAETRMLGLVTGLRRLRPAGAPNREDVFLTVIVDRSRKIESPEGARPQGRFASLADAAAQFRASRDSAIRFVEQNTDDLRATEVTHPHPIAGDVSAYEMLIIMARHAERHALQIAEIKNSAAFRASMAAKD